MAAHPPPPPHTPGIVRFYNRLHDVYLPWVGSHFLIFAVFFLASVITWKLAGYTREYHQRKMQKTRGPKTSQVRRTLAAKLEKQMGHTPDIKWPKHPGAPGAVVTVGYAEGWAALEHQTQVVRRLVEQVLGGSWVPDHDHRHGLLRFVREAPPVTLPSLFKYPDTGPIDHIPVAIDSEGKALIADLTSQSPHVLVAGSTGGGKTTTVTVLIAHIAARDGLVSICDPKMVGYQKTFEGLHNVMVSVPNLDDSVDDMVGMVSEFYLEMRERYAYMREHSLTELPKDFPTRVLAIDEMGSFVSMIREHWAATRRRGEPPKPPTLDAIQKILWQGRMARCHMICAVQQANADAIGGSGSTDMREMYGLRICCGAPGKRGGALLFGTDDIPQVNGILGEEIKGRGLISREGGDVVAVQLAYLIAADARKIAKRGNAQFAAPDPHLSSEDEEPTYARVRTRVDPSVTALHDVTDEVVTDLVTDPVTDSPLMLTCTRCAQSFETTARGGTLVRCKNPACRHPRRVPVNARS